MSFQAVTGASTNAPSVGVEAGLKPGAGGWCPQGQQGRGSEVLVPGGIPGWGFWPWGGHWEFLDLEKHFDPRLR